jgi:hypothetical protein
MSTKQKHPMFFIILENNYLWHSKYYYDISVDASTYTDLKLTYHGIRIT